VPTRLWRRSRTEHEVQLPLASGEILELRSTVVHTGRCVAVDTLHSLSAMACPSIIELALAFESEGEWEAVADRVTEGAVLAIPAGWACGDGGNGPVFRSIRAVANASLVVDEDDETSRFIVHLDVIPAPASSCVADASLDMKTRAPNAAERKRFDLDWHKLLPNVNISGTARSPQLAVNYDSAAKKAKRQIPLHADWPADVVCANCYFDMVAGADLRWEAGENGHGGFEQRYLRAEVTASLVANLFVKLTATRKMTNYTRTVSFNILAELAALEKDLSGALDVGGGDTSATFASGDSPAHISPLGEMNIPIPGIIPGAFSVVVKYDFGASLTFMMRSGSVSAGVGYRLQKTLSFGVEKKGSAAAQWVHDGSLAPGLTEYTQQHADFDGSWTGIRRSGPHVYLDGEPQAKGSLIAGIGPTLTVRLSVGGDDAKLAELIAGRAANLPVVGTAIQKIVSAAEAIINIIPMPAVSATYHFFRAQFDLTFAPKEQCKLRATVSHGHQFSLGVHPVQALDGAPWCPFCASGAASKGGKPFYYSSAKAIATRIRYIKNWGNMGEKKDLDKCLWAASNTAVSDEGSAGAEVAVEDYSKPASGGKRQASSASTCSVATTCEDCVALPGCGYCPGSSTCVPGRLDSGPSVCPDHSRAHPFHYASCSHSAASTKSVEFVEDTLTIPASSIVSAHIRVNNPEVPAVVFGFRTLDDKRWLRARDAALTDDLRVPGTTDEYRIPYRVPTSSLPAPAYEVVVAALPKHDFLFTTLGAEAVGGAAPVSSDHVAVADVDIAPATPEVLPTLGSGEEHLLVTQWAACAPCGAAATTIRHAYCATGNPDTDLANPLAPGAACGGETAPADLTRTCAIPDVCPDEPLVIVRPSAAATTAWVGRDAGTAAPALSLAPGVDRLVVEVYGVRADAEVVALQALRRQEVVDDGQCPDVSDGSSSAWLTLESVSREAHQFFWTPPANFLASHGNRALVTALRVIQRVPGASSFDLVNGAISLPILIAERRPFYLLVNVEEDDLPSLDLASLPTLSRKRGHLGDVDVDPGEFPPRVAADEFVGAPDTFQLAGRVVLHGVMGHSVVPLYTEPYAVLLPDVGAIGGFTVSFGSRGDRDELRSIAVLRSADDGTAHTTFGPTSSFARWFWAGWNYAFSSRLDFDFDCVDGACSLAPEQDSDDAITTSVLRVHSHGFADDDTTQAGLAAEAACAISAAPVQDGTVASTDDAAAGSRLAGAEDDGGLSRGAIVAIAAIATLCCCTILVALVVGALVTIRRRSAATPPPSVVHDGRHHQSRRRSRRGTMH
jgi:hypothetical protein